MKYKIHLSLFEMIDFFHISEKIYINLFFEIDLEILDIINQ